MIDIIYNGRVPACGVFCGGCPNYTRIKKPCKGAEYSDKCERCKTFHLCCKEKGITHCFQCRIFPCSKFKSFTKRWLKYGQNFIENQRLLALGTDVFLDNYNRMVHFETERLVIKEITIEEELKALLAIYTQEENMKYIQSGRYDWTLQELKARYKATNETGYPKGYGVFAVKLRGENKIIGEAGLFNSFSDPGKMEVGYIIDQAYWNKGYGTEVCQGLIDYAFSRLGCTELIARMYDQNMASVRVCEKLGFEYLLTGEAANKKVFREYRKTFIK